MPDKKRILILTADAGFGHRSAANAIAAALTETHGDEAVIEIVNPLDAEDTPSWLRNQQSDYDKLVRETPEFYKFRYEASDAPLSVAIIENALTVMLYTTMRKLIKRHRPDAIVCPYPFYIAPLSAVFNIRNHFVPLLVAVTDLVDIHKAWLNDAADLCMVPTQPAYDQAIEGGLPPERVALTGIPVNPRVVKEDRPAAVIRAELGWQPDLRTVLAVGSPRVEHLSEVLRPLNHSGLPVQLAVVAGGDDDLYDEFQNTEWHARTYVYNFVRNLPAMMHAADCIVTKAGGLIITESLACGLPMLLIDVLPGQEAGNAAYVVENGAGIRVDDPVEALETVFHWFDRDGVELTEFAHNARRLGRPGAAYDIAERAWNAAVSGPQTRTLREILGVPRLTDLLDRYGVPLEDQ